MKNRKMATIMGRLRFDWMRRRGDFIRPREIPLDTWKRMGADQREQHLMKRLRVSA